MRIAGTSPDEGESERRRRCAEAFLLVLRQSHPNTSWDLLDPDDVDERLAEAA